MIRRVRRTLYAGRRVQVFKHGLEECLGYPHEAEAAYESGELLDKVEPSSDLVVIGEAQFFDWKIVDACNMLADWRCAVIASGLDIDFRDRHCHEHCHEV